MEACDGIGIAGKRTDWQRAVLVLLIGLTLGLSLLLGLSVVLRASDYYAERLSLAVTLSASRP